VGSSPETFNANQLFPENERAMNKKKKLYYLIAGLAILSMGATYSATSMLEIGPFATITGGFPELESPSDWYTLRYFRVR